MRLEIACGGREGLEAFDEGEVSSGLEEDRDGFNGG